MQQNTGDPASPSRDRASHGAADGVSALRASPAIAPMMDRAQIRLQAWKLLEGWGNKDAEGKHVNHGFDQRMANAARLADWAMCGEVHVCSFCGKDAPDVACLVAGPVSMICNECIAICAEVVTEKLAQAIEARRAETGTGSARESAVAESDAPKENDHG